MSKLLNIRLASSQLKISLAAIDQVARESGLNKVLFTIADSDFHDYLNETAANLFNGLRASTQFALCLKANPQTDFTKFVASLPDAATIQASDSDDIDLNYNNLPLLSILSGVTDNDLSYFPATRNNLSLYANIDNGNLLFSTKDQAITDQNLFNDIMNGKSVVLAAKPDDYDHYRMTFKAAANTYRYLRSQTSSGELYTQIAIFDHGQTKLVTIADLLFNLDAETQNQILTALANARVNQPAQIKSVLNRILDQTKLETGRNLLSQEEQIETFLELSKIKSNAKGEYVSDSVIDTIKNSQAYKASLAKLKQAGFGLSHTQQFNVLQSCGYFGRKCTGRELALRNPNVLYNLSDMGAGKTLMTVQAIYILNYQRYLQTKDILTNVKNIKLADVNLIAPTLSIKSSWLDTFEIFYDINKIDDNTYELSTNIDGHKLISTLNVAGFTARSNAITITSTLPRKIDKSFLIIDEIHQLAMRKLSARKFFAKGVVPATNYQSFILSGTLSDLTTDQWYNLIHFLGSNLTINDDEITNMTPQYCEDRLDQHNNQIINLLSSTARNLEKTQHRFFDPDVLDHMQITPTLSSRMTKRDAYFHSLYSPMVVTLDNPDDEIRSSLTNKQFSLTTDFSILQSPNFKLFYQLVGSSAITAQSQVVAKELFGNVAKQHKSEIIKAKTVLSDTDIKILKALHRLTLNYQVYKSPAIADQINNAILNLNDGLSKRSIYDVVNNAANHNVRFLKFLAEQNLDLLKLLPKSNLIKQPELKDTPKFKILQNLLKQGKNNTYLIVVNDYDAMKTLSDALGINHFTKKQIKDQIGYQDSLNDMFDKQNIVIVPQKMIKSSLDLVQANRLIQYQLNSEIADIIQTQNRINRIGQTRETRSYYIATDQLQENIINLFLETYRNIRVAHKGIVELFVDVTSQVNVVNDYLSKAMDELSNESEKAIDNSIDQTANKKSLVRKNDQYQKPIEKDGQIILFDPSKYEQDVKPVDEETEDDDHIIDLSRVSAPGELPLFDTAQLALMNGLKLI